MHGKKIIGRRIHHFDIPRWRAFLTTPGPTHLPLQRKHKESINGIYFMDFFPRPAALPEHLPVYLRHEVGLEHVHGPSRLGLVEGERLQRLRGGLEVELGQDALARTEG